jgi:branched-chain amino acid transport system ATP-binding protein
VAVMSAFGQGSNPTVGQRDAPPHPLPDVTSTRVWAGCTSFGRRMDNTGGSGILQVNDLVVTFGGVVALDGASFSIDQGQICGLIGPNGAGKTTLFNVVSRLYEPKAGSVTFDGIDLLSLAPHQIAGIGVARSFQNLALFPALSVLDNVMIGAHHSTRANFITGALRLPNVRAEERRVRERCVELLGRLDLVAFANHPAAGLPYGTLKRVEIARALAGEPRLLLLDEPASGLNHSEVDELGDVILELRDTFDVTILLVEHHMSLVMRVSDHVVALDLGAVIARGSPAEVANDPLVVAAYLGGAA